MTIMTCAQWMEFAESDRLGSDISKQVTHAVSALVFSAARCCPTSSYAPLLSLLSTGASPPLPLPRDPLAPWSIALPAAWPSHVDLRANAVINMYFERRYPKQKFKFILTAIFQVL